jgi:pimeloyl-ACP methyl ester carboxylesterase
MATAKVRGLNIHFEIIGDKGPAVALFTGGRRGYDEFIPLGKKIASYGYRVFLHDRRNTGASEMLLDDKEVEEAVWADDLAELLRQHNALPAFVGGSSSGARTAMMTYLRHRDAVKALLLFRVTGGAFAAQRLPENYYGQFITAAKEGGMAAVCATEAYQERIKANPANKEKLMAMDPQRFIAIMSKLKQLFEAGANLPVMGISEAELKSMKVPTIVIPGNDKTHNSASGRVAQQMIPGAKLHQLPLEDVDLPLVPFEDWAPYEDEIAKVFVEFMRQVEAAKVA